MMRRGPTLPFSDPAGGGQRRRYWIAFGPAKGGPVIRAIFYEAADRWVACSGAAPVASPRRNIVIL